MAMTSGDTPDMNLTPFLDLVLQLLMFFIVCANTQAKENNADVKLPDSPGAAVVEGAAQDVIFVNIKPFDPERDIPPGLSSFEAEAFKERFRSSPMILLTGEKPKNLLDYKLYIQDAAKRLKGQAGDRPITTAIVLRAHRDLDYAEVYRIMQMSKTAGFKTFKMRAMKLQGGKGS